MAFSLISVASLVAAMATPAYAAAAVQLRPHFPGRKAPNCAPSRQVDMHYGNDRHSYVNVSLSTTHPAVMLEQLSSVSSVDCDDYSVAVKFNSSSAFQAAAAHWNVNASDPADQLLFITNHLGDCDAELERGFFMASAIAVNNQTMTIVASTTKTQMNETASDIDINFQGVPQSAAAAPAAVSIIGPSNSTVSNYTTNSTTTFGSRATRTKRASLSPSLSIDHTFSLQPMVLVQEDPVTVSLDEASVQAAASISGHISYSFFTLKVKEFTIDYDATVDTQLGVDVTLKGALHDELKYPFPPLTFSPFEVPGILALGPQLSFSVGVGLAVAGAVSMNAKLGASIAKGSVHIDVKDQSKSTSSGWTPQLTSHALSVSESITANIDPFIDVNLGVGCNVLNGLLDLTVGLDAQPRFKNAFTLSATQVVHNGTVTAVAPAKRSVAPRRALAPRRRLAPRGSCPNGLEIKSDFVFNLTAVVTNFFTAPLYSVTVPIADKCVN